MTITIDTADPRTVRALALLDTAHTIPGSNGRVYWTDTHDCTCPDYQHRRAVCKHVIAARLWVARQKADQDKRDRAERIAAMRALVANA